ncbi:SDR family NAD(P)-dependent oxidoreductase [Streptomyces indicus]|uniref:NADP-dependent 3-hydroxy acid dehydrogenase YdfG n=1 Tax=Streptomyces indicus TaxID=417292 RepID=A0A1G9AVJ7_9ACTN|nr:SDR family oxidoreductase [Streptomyces indicus]SDK31233.1 NADP-dependent 3-hydroxy acid dehydrogenase YdfG [Streptomyces indicus]
MSDQTFQGTRALVTGAGRGFGYAIAERLLGEGAQVAVTGRDRARLAEAARRLRARGGTVLELPGDAKDPATMTATVARVAEEWGALDLLVDNAGVAGPGGPTWEIEAREWWSALEDNLLTTVASSCAAVESMLRTGGGRVVHISSEAGNGIWPFVSSYSVAKAGCIKFFENLAYELRGTRVEVYTLHPGILETGLTAQALTYRDDPDPWRRRCAAWFARQIHQGNTISLDDALDALTLLAAGRTDCPQGRFVTVADVLGAREDSGAA